MNQLNAWATIFTICAGLFGQACFVALYATRDWRKYRITRALMLKSTAFLMIFVLSFTRLLTRGLRTGIEEPLGLILFQLALDTLIVVAIYYQLFALIMEIRSGRDLADSDMRDESA